MQEYMFTKQDWKLFRAKVADWQESHMDKLCREYIELLSREDNPSEKFWQLDRRIKEDKRSPGVQIRMTRTNFIYDIILLISDGVITVGDLEDFSDELKKTVNAFLERQNCDFLDEDKE